MERFFTQVRRRDGPDNYDESQIYLAQARVWLRERKISCGRCSTAASSCSTIEIRTSGIPSVARPQPRIRNHVTVSHFEPM